MSPSAQAQVAVRSGPPQHSQIRAAPFRRLTSKADTEGWNQG